MLKNRLQFYRGTTQVLQVGYQPYDDKTLPACWLECLVDFYFDHIVARLDSPRDVKIALENSGTGRFVLDVVNPTHNDRFLVRNKFVEFWDESKARPLDDIFVDKLLGARIKEIRYISNDARNSTGMRFDVDKHGFVTKRFHAHSVPVKRGMLQSYPDLHGVLLAIIAHIANSFTEDRKDSPTFAEEKFLQGLSDSHRTPFIWRSDARRMLHRLPEDVFDAVEISSNTQHKKDRINQFEKITQEATKRLA